MGLMSRNKGRRFEQVVARALRQRWPGAVVRRASQADRAHRSDVYFEGGPELLERLWLELQDAASPTPEDKLDQATRDCHSAREAMRTAGKRAGEPRLYLPVVVWHRLRERAAQATMALGTLLDLIGSELRDPRAAHASVDLATVTLDMEEFLDLLQYVAGEAPGATPW